MIRPMSETPEFTVVATGLRFPEGPIAMADGSVVLVEIARQTLTRVLPDGTTTVVAECGGGPNGAAVGPDGAFYLANNGGFFTWMEISELTVPGRDAGHLDRRQPPARRPGHRDRRDVGHPVRRAAAAGPQRRRVRRGRGTVVHRPRREGRAGGHPRRRRLPVGRRRGDPRGVPHRIDQRHRPVARPATASTWPRPTRAACGPGTSPGPVRWGPIRASDAPHGGTLLYDAPEGHLFDSLGVDGDGWVCVATLGQGGITVRGS